ncbi:mucin-2-like [Palaemon carinicauda]|uniref:mucin-2-like n=1 Tax=Palaemon carinicauda TaxID=392227 RepID=UPI0035B612EB
MRGATVVVVIGLSLLLRSSVSGEQDVPSDAVLEAVRLLQDVKETLRVPVAGMIDNAKEISQRVQEMVMKSDKVVMDTEKEMEYRKNFKENEKKPPQKEKVEQQSAPKSKLRIVGVRVDASSNSIPMERLVGADTSRQTGKESIPDELQDVLSIDKLPNSERISESFVKGRNGRARVVKMRRPISVPDAQESGSEAIDWAAFDPENVHDFEGYGRRIQPKGNKKDFSEPKNSHESSILEVNDSSNIQNLSGTSKVNEIKSIANTPEPSKNSVASTRELIDGKSQSYKPRVVTQTPTTASSTSIRKRVRIPSISRLRTSSQIQSTSQTTSKPTTEQLRITTPTSHALLNENELDLRRISSKSQNSSQEEAPSYQFEPPPVSQTSIPISSRLLRPASTKGNHITTLQPQPISTTSKFVRPLPTTSSRNPSKSVRPVTIRHPTSPSITKTSVPPVSSTHQPLALSSLVPGAPFRAPITPLLPVSSLSTRDQTQKPLSILTTINPKRKPTISRVPQIFSTASFDFSRIPHTSPSPTTPRGSVSPFFTSQRPFLNSGPTEDFKQSLFTSRPTASPTNSASPFSHPSITTSLHSPFTSLGPIITTTQRPLSSPNLFVSTTVPTITTSPHIFVTSSNPRNSLRRPTVTTNVPSLTSRRPKIITSHLDSLSQRPRVTTNSPFLNSNFPDIFKSNPSSLFTSPSSTTLQDDAKVTTSTDPVTIIKSPEPPFTGFSFQSFRPGSTSSSSFNIGSPVVATHNEHFTNQIPKIQSPKGSKGNLASEIPQKQPQRLHGFSPSPLSTTSSDNFTPSSLATIGLFTSSTPRFGVGKRPTSFPRVSTTDFLPSQSPAGNFGPRITTFRPTFSPTTPRPKPSPSLLPIDTLAPVTPHTSFATRFSRPQTIANEITKHNPPLTSDISNFPELPISNPNIFQILQQQSLQNFEPQHLTTANPRKITTSKPKQTFISSRPRDPITTFRPKQLSTTSTPSTRFTTATPRQSLSTSTRPLTTKAPFFQFFSLGGQKLVTPSSLNNRPSNLINAEKTSQPHVTTPRVSVTTPFPFITSSRPVLTSPLPIVTTLRPNALNPHAQFNRISSPRPTTANIFEEVPSSISPLGTHNRINNFNGFSLNEDRPSLALFPQNAFVNSQNNVLSPIPVTQPSLTTPLSPFLAAFSNPEFNRVHESQRRNKEKNIHLFRPHLQNSGVSPGPRQFSPTLPPIKDKFPFRPLNSFSGQSTLSTAVPIITTARGPFTFDPSRFITTTQEPFVFRHTTTRRSITAANSFSNGDQVTSLRPILREPSTIPPLLSSTISNIPIPNTSSMGSGKPSTWQPLTKPNPDDNKPHSKVQSINEVSPVPFTSPRPKVQTNVPPFSSFGAVTSFESVRRSTTAKPIIEIDLTAAPTEASQQVNLHQLTTKLPIQETSASTTQPFFVKRPITVLPATAMTESNRLVPTMKSFLWSSNKVSHSTRKPMLSPLTSPNVILQPAARSGSRVQPESKALAKNNIQSPSPIKSTENSLKNSPKALASSTQKPRTTAKVPSNVFRPSEPITGKSFIFVRSGGHEYRVVWL